VDALGGGEGGEGDAERIDGLVITTNAKASADEIEGADGAESDDDPSRGTEDDHLKSELRPASTVDLSVLCGGGDGHDDYREQDDVIQAALDAERLANGRAELGAADDSAEKDGICGSECGAKHCGEHDRYVQEPNGSCGDECGGEQRAGTEYEKSEQAVLAEIFDVEGDGVHEEDEGKAEGGDGAEDGRLDGDVDEGKSVGSDDRAESKEYGDLRQTRAFDKAGKERRSEDDDANEGEGGGEEFWTEIRQRTLLRERETV
jgi:hypothetical protein